MTQTMTTHTDLILDGIREISTYYGSDWAGLSALRDQTQLPRETFDAALTALAYAGVVVLVPEDNQKCLTSADWHNALYVGGEHKHLARIA
jgi:hypothetical protein